MHRLLKCIDLKINYLLVFSEVMGIKRALSFVPAAVASGIASLTAIESWPVSYKIANDLLTAFNHSLGGGSSSPYVIAAGAVVTKNVEAFTIVGGVPAKPIGERQNKDHRPRPGKDKVAKHHHERRPDADAPRAREQVAHGVAKAVVEGKQVAKPTGYFVIHNKTRNPEGGKSHQERIKWWH